MYGPWSPGVLPLERGKQLRCLAGIAATRLGSDHSLITALRRAELGGELDKARVLFENCRR
jgi:hypothetical protein